MLLEASLADAAKYHHKEISVNNTAWLSSTAVNLKCFSIWSFCVVSHFHGDQQKKSTQFSRALHSALHVETITGSYRDTSDNRLNATASNLPSTVLCSDSRPILTQFPVLSQGSLFEIYGRQCSTGTAFSKAFTFSPCHYHSTKSRNHIQSLIIDDNSDIQRV